jgi:hypothetical protein
LMQKKFQNPQYLDFRKEFHSNVDFNLNSHIVAKEENSFSVTLEILEILWKISSSWSFSDYISLNYYINMEKEKQEFIEIQETKKIPNSIFLKFKYYGKLSSFAFREPLDELFFNTNSIDLVLRDTTPKKFRPAYLLCFDHPKKTLTLLLRGTKNIHDLLTDLKFEKVEFQVFILEI